MSDVKHDSLALQALHDKVAELIQADFFDAASVEAVNLKLERHCAEVPELYPFLLTVTEYLNHLCPFEVLVGQPVAQRNGVLDPAQVELINTVKAVRQEKVLALIAESVRQTASEEAVETAKLDDVGPGTLH